MTQFDPQSVSELQAFIAERCASGEAVEVIGRGTKRNFANACQCKDQLSVAGLNGINFYEPSELAISVQAGTPLSLVEAELAKANQRFSFEPPRLGKLLVGKEADPSIGGLVASNLAGPARVSRGALRDHLLGVEFINGKGDVVKSGGRVMKNVTGYDLCKLLAGSWGTLGVLNNVVLKTLPKMETETTLIVHCDDPVEGGKIMRKAMGTPFDLIAAAYVPSRGVALRVEGLEQSVSYRISELEDLIEGYETSQIHGSSSIDFWLGIQEIADHLEHQEQVWKVSVAPTDGPEILKALTHEKERSAFLDWSGGLVWIGCKADDATVRADLEPWLRNTAGGHATLVKGQGGQLREILPHSQNVLMQQIKRTFDPKGILSPGRFV